MANKECTCGHNQCDNCYADEIQIRLAKDRLVIRRQKITSSPANLETRIDYLEARITLLERSIILLERKDSKGDDQKTKKYKFEYVNQKV